MSYSKNILFLIISLFSFSNSFANDKNTSETYLSIKGALTNYNKCSYNKNENKLKCDEETAHIKNTSIFVSNDENNQKIQKADFYIY